ncbi:MAG: hypothetical protein M1827_002018 [Pycnora praestabilis]|nr:MAG: hypothetical protein M1827_002018 [Pycnora praestabilis]
MPARLGEDLLLTLFADVHYYFAPPSARPLHHRLDKESYVYLYRNLSSGRGRLEIANNAGTSEQDALDGSLDSVDLVYSYKHPAMVTLTVDGLSQQGGTSPSSRQEDPQWCLPTPDPRNEGKYMYPLHSLDMYFWTREDATDFLDSIKKAVPERQIKISDGPQAPPAHNEAMSPVVQMLENAAISDPAYHNGQSGNKGAPPAFIPPPPPPPSQSQGNNGVQSSTVENQPASFAPLAYNPAAPAAPEKIMHREKTPPPPESAGGTGLVAAAYEDHNQAFQPPPMQHQVSFPPPPPGQSPQQQQYFSGPPQSANAFPPPPPSSMALQQSPAPSASPYGQNQRVSSFASPSQDPNAGLYGHVSPGPQSPPQQQGHASPYGQQPQQQYFQQQPQQSQQYSNYPQAAGQTPLQSPGIQSPGIQSPPLAPVGGYSNYQYSQPQAQQQQGNGYGIHSQVYRPTETEVSSHGHVQSKPSAAGRGQNPGKLEARADKVEKGVNRFLKRLEKKIG